MAMKATAEQLAEAYEIALAALDRAREEYRKAQAAELRAFVEAGHDPDSRQDAIERLEAREARNLSWARAAIGETERGR